MENSRRKFFKQGMAGALALTLPAMVKAETANPNGKKKGKSENPFSLGLAGYTFVHFDLETTLKTMKRLGVKNLCIKDFHLPLNSTDEQIKAFHAKCAEYGVKGYAVGPIYMKIIMLFPLYRFLSRKYKHTFSLHFRSLS